MTAPSSRWRTAARASLLVGFVLVGAGGWLLGRSAAADDARAREARQRYDVLDRKLEVVLASQSALQAQLLALGRGDDALRAASSSSPAPPTTIASPAAMADAHDLTADREGGKPAQRRPESVDAENAAHGIVDDAVRVGRWTAADRDHMRQTFASLDDDGRRAILRELAVEINAGRLAVTELEGPPL